MQPFSLKSETFSAFQKMLEIQNSRIILSLDQLFSSRNKFVPKGSFGNVWRQFWLSHQDGVEARGAAKHPATHRTGSPPKHQAEISLEPKASDPRVGTEEACASAKGIVLGVRCPGIQPLL